MSTLSLTPILPPDQTGVAVASKLDGYTIKWDTQDVSETVEVWQNTSNVRSTATKVATVTDTYYDSPTLVVGTPYYLWTRRVNSFAVPGNWDLGETAGRTITVGGVKAANTAIGALTATSISVSGATGSTVPSTYNTWTDTGIYAEFTAPSGTAVIAGFMFLTATVDTVVYSGSFSLGELAGRVVLYNQTDGVEVPSFEQYHIFAVRTAISGVPLVEENSTIGTFKYRITSGFGDGALIPGKTYRLKVQLNKQRVTADITFNADIGASGTSSATAGSATVA